MTHWTVQGIDVPALGLGTYRLTGRACRRGVANALDIGYRHIDTAQAYGNEADVGAGIRKGEVDREEIFLTTKVWTNNLFRGRVRASAEESLSKLDTEYVDLLLIHWPTTEMELGPVLDEMLALKEEGKTRHVGVSNFTPSLMRRALSHGPIFCNQVEYHPYLDQRDLLDTAREHDVLVTAYSPIARGKVLKDPVLRKIASTHDKTPAQVSLRWLIQQDRVAAIPKASKRRHRRQNFDVFDFELSDEEMTRIFGLARGERIVDPAWAPAW